MRRTPAASLHQLGFTYKQQEVLSADALGELLSCHEAADKLCQAGFNVAGHELSPDSVSVLLRHAEAAIALHEKGIITFEQQIAWGRDLVALLRWKDAAISLDEAGCNREYMTHVGLATLMLMFSKAAISLHQTGTYTFDKQVALGDSHNLMVLLKHAEGAEALHKAGFAIAPLFSEPDISHVDSILRQPQTFLRLHQGKIFTFEQQLAALKKGYHIGTILAYPDKYIQFHQAGLTIERQLQFSNRVDYCNTYYYLHTYKDAAIALHVGKYCSIEQLMAFGQGNNSEFKPLLKYADRAMALHDSGHCTVTQLIELSNKRGPLLYLLLNDNATALLRGGYCSVWQLAALAREKGNNALIALLKQKDIIIRLCKAGLPVSRFLALANGPGMKSLLRQGLPIHEFVRLANEDFAQLRTLMVAPDSAPTKAYIQEVNSSPSAQNLQRDILQQILGARRVREFIADGAAKGTPQLLPDGTPEYFPSSNTLPPPQLLEYLATPGTPAAKESRAEWARVVRAARETYLAAERPVPNRHRYYHKSALIAGGR